MKTKDKAVVEKKWMQNLIAVLIVLIGAAVSLLILTSTRGAGDDTEPATFYTVTFYDTAGQVLDVQKVESGHAVIPLPFAQNGFMFKRWDKELHAVSMDLEVYPVCEAVGDAKNIVYADTVYADTEKVFSVTPKLSGTVDCSGFTIEMGYDDELLHFEGADAILAGVTVEERNGTVIMTWSDDTAITEETALAALCFKSNKSGAFGTNLPFLTKEIVTIENGAEVYTDSTAYDGKLYLYQK